MFCPTPASRALAASAFSVAVVLLLGSCLSLRTTIAIDDSDAAFEGRIVFEYTLDPLFFEIGVYDNDDPMTILPISRNDFELLTARNDGLDLASYSWEEGENGVLVQAELAFADAGALEAALGQETSATGTGQSGALRLALSPGLEEGTDGDIAALLHEVSPEAALTFVLTAPGPISTASPGSRDGDRATFEVTLVQLARAQEQIVWEVEW